MTTHVRQGPPKVRLWTSGLAEVALDHDVIAFSVNTSLGQPAGTWSLTLLPRTSSGLQTPADVRRAATLYNSIRPNNVVSIGFQQVGGIMLGLVSTCQRSQQMSGPVAGVTLTITGTTIGKVLIQDSVYKGTVAATDFPAFGKAIKSALGEDTPITTNINGQLGPAWVEPDREVTITSEVDGSEVTFTIEGGTTPTFARQGVKTVVDWILGNTTSMRLPLFAIATGGSGEPADYFITDKCVTTWHNAQVFSNQGPQSYQGTIWGFIQSILDSDIYECWVDSVPNGTSLPEVHLIIRPKPFDEPDFDVAPIDRSNEGEDSPWNWGNLKTMVTGDSQHEIDISECLTLQLGFGDTDAVSWYTVTGTCDPISNAQAQNNGTFYPLVDTYVAKTMGLRSYSATLNLVAGDIERINAEDAAYDPVIISEAMSARNRLFNWYRYASWMENGSITVVGRDDYRPGDPVFLPWVTPAQGGEAGVRYYCQGVAWAWQHGGHYTSTLQLSRGHNSAQLTAIRDMIDADADANAPDCPHHWTAVGGLGEGDTALTPGDFEFSGNGNTA